MKCSVSKMKKQVKLDHRTEDHLQQPGLRMCLVISNETILKILILLMNTYELKPVIILN